MSSWFLFICVLLFNSCDGFQFNLTRVMQGDRLDLFSNMDPSGSCPRKNDDGRAWCRARNGDCSSKGCCTCTCTYNYSTFRMEPSPKNATCVENSAFRRDTGCSQRFATIQESNPLLTLDLAIEGSKNMMPNLTDKCKIDSAQFLDQLKWEDLGRHEEGTFDIKRISKWPYTVLTWNGKMPSSYFGYVMKLNGSCGRGPPWGRTKFCVVFKTKGTLSYPTTHLHSTTAQTTVATTKGTTQVKSTTTVTSTTETTIKTTLATKDPSSKEVTTKRITTRPPTETPKVTKSSTESSATTEPVRTEQITGDVTTIEPTSNIPRGTTEPDQGGNKLSNKQEIDDGTMIAIIAAVAAVICVAVILLCLWFIFCQRRKNRDSANFGAGTTVVANPTTRSQNHFSMPGLLKNPVFDGSVYAEPEERARKAAVELIGTPSHDRDLLLKNPGAKDTQSTPLNNTRTKPLNTASRKSYRENTYASAERYPRGTKDAEKPIYHNPGCVLDGEKPVYQSLVKEDARAQFNSNPNVAVYQSLNHDEVLYQPLQTNTIPKCQEDIPEYLVLLNPNESSRNISPPPAEYQPPYSTGLPPADAEESPEYDDYADLDELEEIAAKEGSNKCSDQGPSYVAPVYNALEGPSYDYACPGGVVYDVLECPDSESNGIVNQGFEPPTYAVLEGPDTTS